MIMNNKKGDILVKSFDETRLLPAILLSYTMRQNYLGMLGGSQLGIGIRA